MTQSQLFNPNVEQAEFTKQHRVGFNWHRDPHRTYFQGRPLHGHKHGRMIQNLDEVKVGMLLVQVSHQFKSENIVEVTQLLDKRFYAHYAFGQSEGTFCVWDHDVTGESSDYYIAEPLVVEDLTRQLLEQLGNIHDGNDDEGNPSYAGRVDQWLVQALADRLGVE